MKGDILDDYYQGTGMIGVGMGSVTESGGTLESDAVDVRTFDHRTFNHTRKTKHKTHTQTSRSKAILRYL